MSNFTPEELIAFHYGETSPIKSAEIAKALDENWALQEKYRVIKEASSLLDKGLKSPGWRSLRSVLDHAEPTVRHELRTNYN